MVSQVAINLVKRFEGCKLHAYLDGGGVATIGYGTTVYNNGNKVKIGDVIDQERADFEIKAHCEKIEKSILNLVHAKLNNNQLSAIISLVYNIGINNFRFSTMLKKINNNNFVGAANEFDRWVWDNGKVIKGLQNRREEEKQIFLR